MKLGHLSHSPNKKQSNPNHQQNYDKVKTINNIVSIDTIKNNHQRNQDIREENVNKIPRNRQINLTHKKTGPKFSNPRDQTTKTSMDTLS